MSIEINKIIILVLIYSLVILFPIIFYIKRIERKNVFKYLKLIGNFNKGVFLGFVLSGIFVLLLFTKKYFIGGSEFNFNIGDLWICGFLAGFMEEIPLRGFALEKLKQKFGFWKGNIIVTLIFVVLHYPMWIINGTNIINSSITISSVSLCFGYLVNEYDSLWITIICHSVFNIFFWLS